jgi:hypothetical protein
MMVEYRMETRTITLTPSGPKIADLQAKLGELELQLGIMKESQATRIPRVVSAIIAGTGSIAFSALAVFASMAGNGIVAESLLTPAFVGAVAAITLMFLISKE